MYLILFDDAIIAGGIESFVSPVDEDTYMSLICAIQEICGSL